MIPSFLRAVFAAALACSFASTQQVWKVHSQGGPGVHFTDLPPAVAAAAPGDTIMVWLTVGFDYSATTIDKPLHIFGFTIVPAPWSGPVPTRARFKGLFTITGIPAGQQVTLSNIAVGPQFPPPPSHVFGLVVTDCAGDVLLEDVIGSGLGIAGMTMRVERCANVVFRGCEIYLSGSPVFVEDASLLLTTTSIRHFAPLAPWGYVGTSHSLDVKNSTVTMVGSGVFGGDQVYAGTSSLWATKPGALLNQGVLHVAPASLLIGGKVLGQPVYSPGYIPVPSLNPSTVYVDPRATVWDPPHLVLPPIPRAIHATYHAWVVADEDYAVTVAGPSGGFALLAFGDWTPSPVVTPFGTLALDPSNVQVVDLVALTQASGSHQWIFHCPPTAPNGYPFVFQALTLAPDGTLALAIPTPLTVGWEHGRIP